MSLLLCHECYSWTEPTDGRCPDCQQLLDPDQPDPPLDALGAVIGDMAQRLGEVRVRRKLLPERGTLYATTNGLYFVPHRTEHVTRIIEADPPGSALFWSVASLVWTPLILVLPFVKGRQARAKRIQVHRPQFLTDDDNHRLPELLMDNPGVFFVPLQSIHNVSRRRNKWLIERLNGPRLKLLVDANGGRFHDRMTDLLHSAPWRNLCLG